MVRGWRWMRSTSTSPPAPRSLRSASAARQASRTAPVAIQVMREADAEPAEPTVAVVCGASVTSSVASSRARHLQQHRADALADLGRGAVHDRAAVGAQHDARGAEVVEALREADVLVADGEADAAPHALAARRVARAAGQPARIARGRLGLGQRQRGRLADDLGHGQRARDALPRRQHVARARSRCAAAARPDPCRARRRAGPSAPRSRSTSARRRTRASHRRAGCWCRRRCPRSARWARRRGRARTRRRSRRPPPSSRRRRRRPAGSRSART